MALEALRRRLAAGRTSRAPPRRPAAAVLALVREGAPPQQSPAAAAAPARPGVDGALAASATSVGVGRAPAAPAGDGSEAHGAWLAAADCAAVSAHHLSVGRAGADGEPRFVAVDHGSTNGTTLNGAALAAGRPEEVKDGDVLVLGKEAALRVCVVRLPEGDHEVVPDVAVGFAGLPKHASKPSEDEAAVRRAPGLGAVLLAALDGHAGGAVSARLRRTLLPLVEKHWRALYDDDARHPKDVSEALRAAFREADEDALDSGEAVYAGSTATVVCVWKGPDGRTRVQAANVGDSRALVGWGGRGKAVTRLTYDHRVSDEREAERLRKWTPLPPGATRLYGLALSRAMGDGFHKREQATGLSAEPHVSPAVVIPRDQPARVVLGTDGVWDAPGMADADALQEAWDAATPDEAAHALAETARRARVRDDITAVVAAL